ncbi:MAG TPA: DNA-directed RNA polymerase subunit omega [Saprospiraceae bacterium]|nr:DNA-directed RNA polymerase subunit omega [Saprospiraceae bacterium]HQW56931.1 DNA-directed RNA polymerase subunit omega [Saprospiraceae bacterium]
MDIKTKAQGIDPNCHARDIKNMAAQTSNIYESISVITLRARQLQTELKRELNHKLEEFTVSSDTIEEVQENKEQIEISKFYEKMPNPAIIATEEFLKGELTFRYKDQDQD